MAMAISMVTGTFSFGLISIVTRLITYYRDKNEKTDHNKLHFELCQQLAWLKEFAKTR